ncbi:sterile alpha motif domain-containing protein 9, partial [Biomphalaria glabrata]
KQILTLEDKSNLESINANKERMEGLLLLLKPKEGAYRELIEALKVYNDWVADAIEGTKSDADSSVKSKTIALKDDVRKVLLETYIDARGEKTKLKDIKKLLKSTTVFNDHNKWDDETLVNFVKEVFCDVQEEGVRKHEKGKRIYRRCLTNIGPLKKQGQASLESGEAETESQVSLDPYTKGVAVLKMSPAHLKVHLANLFQKENLPIDDLETLEKKGVSGSTFVSIDSEKLDNLLPNSAFDVKQHLITLAREVSLAVTKSTQALREFDTKVTHLCKYVPGYFTDVSVNTRSKLTYPIKNFHLVKDKHPQKALKRITREAIQFISACLNDRRNGTIYFGICPNDEGALREGEIVGVRLPKEDVNAAVQDALCGSFMDDAVKKVVRDVVFVPLTGTGDRYVIEIDVVPSFEFLGDDIIWTTEDSPADCSKNNQTSVIFRFSDYGYPEILPNEKFNHFKNVQLPKIVEQRKLEEINFTKGKKWQDLRTQLLNCVTGGSEFLTDSIYPFLVTSPLDTDMTQEYLKDKTEFVKHLHPRVVFDFDENSANAGLLKSLEEHHTETPRILTTENFNQITTEKANELKESLYKERRIPWLFCNGHKEQSIASLKPLEWYRKRSLSFQNALKIFTDMYKRERTVVIICLFSPNYETLIEACEEIFKHIEHWIVLSETEFVARNWQDKMLSKNRVDKREIQNKSVIGLQWENVNQILCRAANESISSPYSIVCSTGHFIQVESNQPNDWSDLSIPSDDFLANVSDTERDEIVKNVEEGFYRGDQVDWLNFQFGHVFLRNKHCELKKVVEQALTSPVKDDQEMIKKITIFHQPGAGGTTFAKQILWDQRKLYRCCVVNEITDQTCEQLDGFRNYKDPNPKPILILVDNNKNLKRLKYELELKAREQLQHLDVCYCTIIACERTPELPAQTMDNEVALRQELTPEELIFLKNKYTILIQNYKENHKTNVDPKFLIAFNIMRENYDQTYIANIVSEFLNEIKSPDECFLLKIVALLNVYDPDFEEIPVSCFDTLLNPQPGSANCDHGGARKLHWESELSESIKVLLNISSYRRYTGIRTQCVKMFCKVMAREVLDQIKKRLGQKDSGIMLELLEKNIFQQDTQDYQQLSIIVNNVFKNRSSRTQRRDGSNRSNGSKFSEFIHHVDSNENAETVIRLLEEVFSQNKNPSIAQVLARFYIDKKMWIKAEEYAKRATELCPKSSFLMHTYGLVFQSQILEKVSSGNLHSRQAVKFSDSDICDLIQLATKGIDIFRKGQTICELERSTQEKNNLASYFGELETIVEILNALQMSIPFQHKDVLQKFLTHPAYKTNQHNFLNRENISFIKSLEESSHEAMRRLDDEFLQMKKQFSSNTKKDEYNKRKLIDMKAKLDLFFGEAGLRAPNNLNEREKCQYRHRRARLLGASSLNCLLAKRKNGKRDNLREIFRLLKENMASKMKDFEDYRSMIEITTVCLLDDTDIPGITYDVILEWTHSMYLSKPKSKGNRPHLEMFLYYALYNFPTLERLKFDKIRNSNLLNVMAEWKKAFVEYYPKSKWYKERRETTLFFLAHRKPLSDIVFFQEAEVLQMYTNQKFPEHLRVLKGILSDGGKDVLLNSHGFRMNIPAAYAVKNSGMYNREVEFYMGFSFSGPKAFGISSGRQLTSFYH